MGLRENKNHLHRLAIIAANLSFLSLLSDFRQTFLPPFRLYGRVRARRRARVGGWVGGWLTNDHWVGGWVVDK